MTTTEVGTWRLYFLRNPYWLIGWLRSVNGVQSNLFDDFRGNICTPYPGKIAIGERMLRRMY